MIVDMLFYNSF